MTAHLLSIMLAFLLGFAQIQADDIPEGVMPKRAVVGTGATTSALDTTTAPTTADTPPTTTDDPTSTQPSTNSPPPTSDPTTAATPPTSAPSSQTSIPNTSAPTTASDPSTVAPQSTDTSAAPSSAQTTAQSSEQSSADSSSQHAPSSSTIPTTIAVTTTNSDGSTVTSHIATSTFAAVTSSSDSGVVQTETGSSHNRFVVVGSSTINPSTLSKKTTITSALVAEETIPSTFTSYWTSNGQVFSSLVTSDQVVASTTGFATATIAPSLANGGGNGSNLSTSTKAVIGGVVGGIGGAVLIGGLAIVAWRLWGKKRRQAASQQDEFLDSTNDSIRQEKRRSSQPFSDTMDRYHNPNGAVNTASNF